MSPKTAANDKQVNLKLIIEYDGSKYFGWQRQTSKVSIQQVLERSLQVLFPYEKINLIGAGRTDAGVHAYGQCANVKLSNSSFSKYNVPGGINKLSVSLNAILPADIVIKKISKAKDDFHARYSARERAYEYFITTSKHAIGGDKLYRIKNDIDIKKAQAFCKTLIGYKSFKSLCKNQTDEHDFKCDVKYAKVSRNSKGVIKFEICASRFLHSMVRAIVGAMIDIASGKMELNQFKQKFKKGEEIKLQYVPAKALFLVKVKY